MWKSVIWDEPEEQDEQGNANPLYNEWVEEVLSEPWFVALRDLVKWTGTWTGAEEKLMKEIKLRVNREVWESEDFPSEPQKLMEYYEIIYFARSGLNLEIFDYSELKKKDLKEFDVPGWGPESALLVEQDSAGRKPFYNDVLSKLTKYENPLLLAFLIFTNSPKFARNRRRWSGGTVELAEVLGASYPAPGLNCPSYLAHLGWSSDTGPGAFYGHKFNKFHKLLDLSCPSDFRRFHERIRTYAYILKEVGIKVGWKKEPWVVKDLEGEKRPIKRTRWTIEAPRWA